jgi:hypothetical protein
MVLSFKIFTHGIKSFERSKSFRIASIVILNSITTELEVYFILSHNVTSYSKMNITAIYRR